MHYTVLKPSTTERVPVRGLEYSVRRWGPADAPKVFLLHGWMDTSATFQFVVDALRHDWQPQNRARRYRQKDQGRINRSSPVPAS